MPADDEGSFDTNPAKAPVTQNPLPPPQQAPVATAIVPPPTAQAAQAQAQAVAQNASAQFAAGVAMAKANAQTAQAQAQAQVQVQTQQAQPTAQPVQQTQPPPQHAVAQPQPQPVQDTPFASAGLMVGAAAGTAVNDVQLKAATYATQATERVQYASNEVNQTVQNMDMNSQREWDRLRTYEEQLQKREEELRRKEIDFESQMPQRANFPRYCPFIKPQVYHNIQTEFIPARKAFMRGLYTNYYLLCFLLVYQSIIDLCALVGSNEGSDDDDDDQPDWAEHFGVSLLYLLAICFAFIVWYWPTYKALSTRNPGQYRWAYLGLAAAVVFNAVMVVGYVGHGGMGVFFCAHVLDKKESGALAIIAVIGCAMLGLQLAYFIYASYRVRSFYKEDVVRQALPSQLASAKEGVVGTSALKEKAKKQAIRSL